MAQQSEAGLSNLTTEQLLALARRWASHPQEVVVRRSIGAGVAWLIFAAILGTIGGFLSYNLADAGAGALIGGAFLLGALWNLIWGIIWIADRSPFLVLGADALVDCRSVPHQRFLWTNIRRATLHRTTRNGAEQSATMTMFLHEAVGGRDEVRINLMNLTHGAQQIFHLIGVRADLK
jgi:hypothetical protein